MAGKLLGLLWLGSAGVGYGGALSQVFTVTASSREIPTDLNCILADARYHQSPGLSRTPACAGNPSPRHLAEAAVRKGKKSRQPNPSALAAKYPGAAAGFVQVARGTLYIAHAAERIWAVGERVLGWCCC